MGPNKRVTRAASASGVGNRRYTPEQVVHKKLHDNFRGWGPADTDLRQVDSLTLRQTVARDLESFNQGKEPRVMGAVYYAKLKALFKAPVSSDTDFVIDDAALPINPRLVNAICAARRAHPDRSALSAYLQTCVLPNQSEFVGLCRYFLSLKPGCLKQLAAGMDAVRFCARLHLDSKFSREFDLIRQWCDIMVEAALVRSRAARTPDNVFCDINSAVLKLVMPPTSLTTVLNAKGSWTTVAEDISKLVASSQTGLRLFTSAIEGVMSTRLAETIAECIDTSMTEDDTLTEAQVLQAQADCQKKVEALPCISLLPQRRSVVMQYRGQDVQVRVLSVQEQVQLSFATVMKSIAVEAAQLVPLWVEQIFVKPDYKCPYEAKLPDSMFASASAVRARLKRAVEDADAVTGDLVKHCLQKAAAGLLVDDPTFKIEMAIIEEMVDEGTGKRIVSAILECLPSLDNHFEAETAALKLHSLASGEAMKLADRSSQEKLKVVQTVVNALVEQRPPDLKEVSKADWMLDIVTRLQFFLRAPVEEGSANPPVNGSAAIEPLLAALTASLAAGTVTMSDIAPLNCFSWLLSKEQKQQADALVTSVSDRWQNDLGESMRKRAKITRGKSKASSSTDVDRAMQESLDLFK